MSRIWRGLLIAIALTCVAYADETLVVNTASVVEFGGRGGDAFTLETVSRNSVVVLLNPHGEDCTLRFVLNIRESMPISAVTKDGQKQACTVSLVSIVNTSTGIFSYRCSNQSLPDEPRCPPRNRTTDGKSERKHIGRTSSKADI